MSSMTHRQKIGLEEIDRIFESLIELRRRKWGEDEIRELTKRLLNKVLVEYNPDYENEINHEIELDENGFPLTGFLSLKESK